MKKKYPQIFYMRDLIFYSFIIIVLTAGNEKSWDVFVSGIISIILVCGLIYSMGKIEKND